VSVDVSAALAAVVIVAGLIAPAGPRVEPVADAGPSPLCATPAFLAEACPPTGTSGPTTLQPNVAGELAPLSVPVAGFSDEVVFANLVNPTVTRFATDGRIFVAEKSGIIKVFDGPTDTTATVFADFHKDVHNYWDRGLLGMVLDPNFPAQPYIYVAYTYDHILGSTAASPRWGTATSIADNCPSPPGPTTDGCVVSSRVVRLRASAAERSESRRESGWIAMLSGHVAFALWLRSVSFLKAHFFF